MRKVLSLSLALLLVFAAGCSSSDSGESAAPSEGVQQTPEAAEPLDLSGTWKQVNSNSEDTWQEATIEGDTITVYWVSDNGDTKSLYWAGSYVPPTDAPTEYSWESENDTEQMSSALLASSDDTKTFTYADGQITYDVTALSVTTTVRLEKQ